MSQLWEQVLGAAITGTRRHPAPVTGWLTQLGVEAPAAGAVGLLDVAAVLTAGRAAAPVLAPARPTPAPVQDPRVAFPADLLTRVGDDVFLLRELVEEAARLGLRAPAACVPQLLEYARTRRVPAAPVRTVTGPVGTLLAGLNPHWRAGLGEPAPAGEDDPWLHPSDQVRVEWLAGMRRTDPERAREFVARALAPRPEKAEFKARVLHLLADPEQAEDAAALEEALDARADRVRAAARHVLSCRRLDSAFQRRMRQRMDRWVQVVRTRRGLAVRLRTPAAFDAADLRDGFTGTPGPGQVRYLVECVPLAAWAGFGGTAEVVRGLAAADEGPVLGALAHRAAAEQDPVWARELFTAGFGDPSWGGWLVPQELADQRIRDMLDTMARGADTRHRSRLPRISRSVVPHLAACLPRTPHHLVDALLEQVTGLPDPGPDLVTCLRRAQPHCTGTTALHIEEAIQRLTLRLWVLDQLRARAGTAPDPVTDPTIPSRGEP